MPKLASNRVPSYRLHKQSGQAIVTLDGRDFHRWLTVDGHATFVDEGADAHIQSLADRYQGGTPVRGTDFGPGRVIIRVRPGRIEHEGLD